jgi:hypothetical protein
MYSILWSVAAAGICQHLLKPSSMFDGCSWLNQDHAGDFWLGPLRGVIFDCSFRTDSAFSRGQPDSWGLLVKHE